MKNIPLGTFVWNERVFCGSGISSRVPDRRDCWLWWGNYQPDTKFRKENRAFLTSVPRKDDPHGPGPAARPGSAPPPGPAAGLRAGAKRLPGPAAPPLSPRSLTALPDFWDAEGHGQRWGGHEAGGHSSTEHLPLSPAGLSPPPARGCGAAGTAWSSPRAVRGTARPEHPAQQGGDPSLPDRTITALT